MEAKYLKKLFDLFKNTTMAENYNGTVEHLKNPSLVEIKITSINTTFPTIWGVILSSDFNLMK
jgi:hypothetical protein